MARYLTGVANDGVNNVPLRQKLAARGGYCAAPANHLEAVGCYLPAEVRAELVARHDDLLHDLAELIRKHDYRFQGETVTDAEKQSIKAALALLGLPSRQEPKPPA